MAHFFVFMFAHMEISAICMPKYLDIFYFVSLGHPVLELGDAVCTSVVEEKGFGDRVALRYITVGDSAIFTLNCYP